MADLVGDSARAQNGAREALSGSHSVAPYEPGCGQVSAVTGLRVAFTYRSTHGLSRSVEESEELLLTRAYAIAPMSPERQGALLRVSVCGTANPITRLSPACIGGPSGGGAVLA